MWYCTRTKTWEQSSCCYTYRHVPVADLTSISLDARRMTGLMTGTDSRVTVQRFRLMAFHSITTTVTAHTMPCHARRCVALRCVEVAFPCLAMPCHAMPHIHNTCTCCCPLLILETCTDWALPMSVAFRLRPTGTAGRVGRQHNTGRGGLVCELALRTKCIFCHSTG